MPNPTDTRKPITTLAPMPATYETNALVADDLPWTPAQVAVIRTNIISYKDEPGTPEELWFFSQVCKRTGLDPFTKQIYAIKRWSGKVKKEVMAIQVGIDGLRLQAQRTHKYGGQLGPFWCGPDAKWTDVWLQRKKDGTVEYPAAAKVGVILKGAPEPFWGVVTWDAYAPYTTYMNGDQEIRKLADLWRRMPAEQLAKCAEAQALRKAAPQETSGLYITEEMEQADDGDARKALPTVTVLRRERDLIGWEAWKAIKARVLGPGRDDEVLKLQDFTPRESELMIEAIENWKASASDLKPPTLPAPVDKAPQAQAKPTASDLAAGKPGVKLTLKESMARKLEQQNNKGDVLTWIWCPRGCGQPIFFEDDTQDGVVHRVPVDDCGQIHDCQKGATQGKLVE